MKALSGMERMKPHSFASYYLSGEYERCLSIGRRKGENNINNACQHVIFSYFYRCKIGRPRLIVFSKFSNKFIMPGMCLNHPDRFCFVCGKFARKEEQKNTTYDIKKMYCI